jgi:hypothetical protein
MTRKFGKKFPANKKIILRKNREILLRTSDHNGCDLFDEIYLKPLRFEVRWNPHDWHQIVGLLLVAGRGRDVALRSSFNNRLAAHELDFEYFYEISVRNTQRRQGRFPGDSRVILRDWITRVLVHGYMGGARTSIWK